MTESRPVRPVPAILAPFQIVALEIGGIFSNPRAVLGGVVGTFVFTGLVVGLFVFGSSLALARVEIEEEELEIDFEPGALVRIGKEMKPEEIPEKIIVEEQVAVAEETPVEETVTKDETPPPEKKEQTEKPKDEPPKIKPRDKPDPNAKPDAKPSDKNQSSNTPYKDLPTVDELPGDPFGDPNGWSDLKKDGDPWATAVMAELNKLKYPSYGAQKKNGTYTFRMKICKDGKVDQVTQKGSTGDPALDKMMRTEIEKITIPKPPAKVLAMMKSNCVTLKYDFKWVASGKIQ